MNFFYVSILISFSVYQLIVFLINLYFIKFLQILKINIENIFYMLTYIINFCILFQINLYCSISYNHQIYNSFFIICIFFLFFCLIYTNIINLRKLSGYYTVVTLMNLIFINFDSILLLIFIELLTYFFFFLFCSHALINNNHSNYISIFYGIVVNFFSTVLLCYFIWLSYTAYGTCNLLTCSVFSSNSKIWIFFFCFFAIKLGLVPFFSFKFNFYKLLPLHIVFFYTYCMFILFIYFYNVISLFSNWYNIVVLLILINTIFLLSLLYKNISIKEFLFFSSYISSYYLLFIL